MNISNENKIFPLKKRKLNEMNEKNSNYNNESLKQKEKKTGKIFDPINEHFNYCPWLEEISTENLSNQINNLDKKIKFSSQNVYYANYKLIKRFINRNIRKESSFLQSSQLNVSNNKIQYLDDLKSEADLFEKMRSIKVLLINSTSKLSD